ncbi:uncharacterized protein MONOS_5485 [Monocercomonoides exilis]|uniref:uncharacterized protein n=1 Tax=Monocercomonoides exilis TaxID=2049356 RepID=UPI00355A23B9|nr:hypothetical protein MONOS_5485 [Monocercomonoides exilis]|eukprot:MONOS_5485.1-p1 / transcript=MONOS_5485.1 / gene=MONOS_5485 / organism=Monocercomonoides_exilis_PA203 / gene_product=unspecified product / transcript_product=unspecified product / location=Mono_scaffold00160:53788-57296(+) / protein_length=1144 / sequence_SO=supercontig / SO=protein_coding / is_pseudo=false
MIFVCIFLLSTATYGELCNITKTQLIQASELSKCLSNFPLDETKDLVSRIKNLLEGYAFRDILMNPPPDYNDKPIDILSVLDEIDNKNYTNGFEKHLDVVKSLRRMRDPHTDYNPPCFNEAAYVTPFSIGFEFSKNGSFLKAVVTKGMMPGLAELCLLFGQVENVLGCEVKAISLNGKGFPKNETPIETLAKWADEEIGISRSRAARLNLAIQSQFSYRMAGIFDCPPDYWNILCIVDGKEKDVKVPFYGLTGADIQNVTEWCSEPGKSKTDEDEDKTEGGQELNSYSDYKAEKPASAQLNSLRSYFPYNSKMKRSRGMPLERAKEIYLDSVASKSKLLQITMTAPYNFLGISSNASISEYFDPKDYFGYTFSPKLINNSKKSVRLKNFQSFELEKPSQQLHFAYHNRLSEQTENTSKTSNVVSVNIPHKAKVILTQTSKNDEVPNENETKVEDEDESDDVKSYLITSTSEIMSYYMPDLKVGLFAISSFMPGNTDSFVKATFDTMKYLKLKNCRKLVIDLRSNTGGSVDLVRGLVRLLFPSLHPLYGRVDLAHSQINDHASPLLADQYRVIMTDFETLQPNDRWFLTSRNKTVKSKDGNTSRTRKWTEQFARNSDFADPFTTSPFFTSFPYAGQRLFLPSEMILLTDGLCGSACAQFAKHLWEMRLAKTVALGFDPAKPTASIDVGSFCSGNVMGSDLFQELLKEQDKIDEELDKERRRMERLMKEEGEIDYDDGYDRSNEEESIETNDVSNKGKRENELPMWEEEEEFYLDKTKLPKPFPRRGQQMSYSMMSLSSWLWDEEDTLMEFKYCPADWTSGFSPSVSTWEGEERVKTAAGVSKLFDVHAGWEVLEDEEGCKSANINHNSISDAKVQEKGLVSKLRRVFNHIFAISNIKSSEEEKADDSHKIYGHPTSKDGKSFDLSRCVFCRCEDGFYLNRFNNCVPVPHLQLPKPEPLPEIKSDKVSFEEEAALQKEKIKNANKKWFVGVDNLSSGELSVIILIFVVFGFAIIGGVLIAVGKCVWDMKNIITKNGMDEMDALQEKATAQFLSRFSAARRHPLENIGGISDEHTQNALRLSSSDDPYSLNQRDANRVMNDAVGEGNSSDEQTVLHSRKNKQADTLLLDDGIMGGIELDLDDASPFL